ATLELDPPRAPSANLTEQLVELMLEVALPKTSATQSLVDAAIEKALKPWRRRKEIENAIQEAADSLPPQAKGFSWSPSEWDIRARQAAAEAIGKLRDGATPEEMKAAARQAVQTIIREFEHQQLSKEVAAWAPLKLRGETAEERDKATTATKAALGTLPV